MFNSKLLPPFQISQNFCMLHNAPAKDTQQTPVIRRGADSSTKRSIYSVLALKRPKHWGLRTCLYNLIYYLSELTALDAYEENPNRKVISSGETTTILHFLQSGENEKSLR